MTDSEIIKAMEDRYNIYMHYYIVMLGLKHNVEIVDTKKAEWNTGRDKPHKLIGNQALYYHWKNIPIISYDELDYEYWQKRM